MTSLGGPTFLFLILERIWNFHLDKDHPGEVFLLRRQRSRPITSKGFYNSLSRVAYGGSDTPIELGVT
jgi:hypothetical protein